MTVASQPADVPSSRVASIDIFRGITIAVMIFVNDLDGVQGLPWWTHHAKAEIDVMTYVDMVFPFFLFLVGLSIPLSIKHRLNRNPSLRSLWLHVIYRSVALLALGLILANAEIARTAFVRLTPEAWTLLALLGMALLLHVYPSDGRYAAAHFRVRLIGLGLAGFMFAIFRWTTADGHTGWIDFSYPEILGLIACTYLAVSLLYIPTRRWQVAPILWFLALTGFSAGCAARWITFERHTNLYVWPFGDGTMALVVMAGVVTSGIFMDQRWWKKTNEKLLAGLGFGLLNLLLAYLLTPLGISKIRDTPTWGLYSSGAAVLCFVGLYWLCDIKKKTAWASFLRPAGANTLTTYLLPDIWFFLASMFGIAFPKFLNAGYPGVLRSAAFTVLILWLAGILYRKNIRLQL